MIISAIQFNPRLSKCKAEVADNVRRCGSLIRRAADMGSQLVVLPELFATGYSFLNKEEAFAVAEQAGSGPTARYMRMISVDLQAYMAWGFVEVADGRLYNSASVSGPDGSIVLTSRKMNLWGNDYLWGTPSLDVPKVVSTDLGLLSAVVCRDVRDKIPGNIPRVATQEPPMFENQKVDIVAMCLNWGKGGFPSNTWMDFVADNKCVAVVSNRWGEEVNGTFVQDFGHGGSAIIEPDWKVHTGGLKFGEDCVVTASI